MKYSYNKLRNAGICLAVLLSMLSCVKELESPGLALSVESNEIIFDTFVGALPEQETKACAYSDTVPGLRPNTAGGYGMLRPKKEGRHTANISMSRHYFEDLSDPPTKATATEVTSVSTFNLVCTTGSAGSESQTWALSGTGTSTGKYWPSSNPSYHFYASNAALTFNAAGCTVAATNTTDVVVCYKASPTYNTSNSLGFSHIFGRIGNVTVSAADGFASSDITNVNIKITPKTGGTYNLRTGAWSSVATGSATTITNTTPGTKNNGLYLVPGTYTVSGTWKAKGKDFDGSGSVTVTAGQQLNISLTLGGGLYVLPGKFTVNSSGKQVSFACGNVQAVVGSAIVSGKYYNASDWMFADNQYDIIGSNPGNTTFAVGSVVDLFCWVATDGLAPAGGLVTGYDEDDCVGTCNPLKCDWGSLSAIVSKYDTGWYTLTGAEVNYLVRTRTDANTKRGKGKIGDIGGLILLPDTFSLPSNCTFASGDAYSSGVNEYTLSGKGSSMSWKDMEAAGAVFLPYGGTRESSNGLSVYMVNSKGTYWTSSYDADSDFFATPFDFSTSSTGYIMSYTVDAKTRGKSVRLVKTVN